MPNKFLWSRQYVEIQSAKSRRQMMRKLKQEMANQSFAKRVLSQGIRGGW